MVSDAEIMQILDEIDAEDNKPNREKVEWERLLAYVSEKVMGYPKGVAMPESFINSIRNAVAALKLQKEGFSCTDFLYLIHSCKDKIEYCNQTIKYQSELHKLNTALKIAKNRYIDAIIDKEQRQLTVANMKGFVVPVCEDDTGVKERFEKECDFDKGKCSVVISSLVSAWLDGKVRIMGM